MIMINTTV